MGLNKTDTCAVAASGACFYAAMTGALNKASEYIPAGVSNIAGRYTQLSIATISDLISKASMYEMGGIGAVTLGTKKIVDKLFSLTISKPTDRAFKATILYTASSAAAIAAGYAVGTMALSLAPATALAIASVYPAAHALVKITALFFKSVGAVLTFIAVGCQTPEGIKKSLSALKTERNDLNKQIQDAKKEKTRLENEEPKIEQLNEQIEKIKQAQTEEKKRAEDAFKDFSDKLDSNTPNKEETLKQEKERIFTRVGEITKDYDNKVLELANKQKAIKDQADLIANTEKKLNTTVDYYNKQSDRYKISTGHKPNITPPKA